METTSWAASGVYFDHANDGYAELTGWVGNDDGLLVLDRDGDGVITFGLDLFGSEDADQRPRAKPGASHVEHHPAGGRLGQPLCRRPEQGQRGPGRRLAGLNADVTSALSG